MNKNLKDNLYKLARGFKNNPVLLGFAVSWLVTAAAQRGFDLSVLETLYANGGIAAAVAFVTRIFTYGPETIHDSMDAETFIEAQEIR